MQGILSKIHSDVRVIMQSKLFNIGGDSFEVDGLLMASGQPYLLECKTALDAGDVKQLCTTAGLVKKHCTKLGLKADDVVKIQNSDVRKVLACPVARPEVITAIRKSSEKLCLIVDSGSSFTIAHDGIDLQTGSLSQTECLHLFADYFLLSDFWHSAFKQWVWLRDSSCRSPTGLFHLLGDNFSPLHLPGLPGPIHFPVHPP